MEPNPDPVQGCEAQYIKGFFPKDKAKLRNIQFDCIVHSNTWEHMYDPVAFLKEVKSIMKLSMYMVFSIPDFEGQLKSCFTSMMNFEHHTYLSEEYVDVLLEAFGFEILKKKKYGNCHSIFYVTRLASVQQEEKIRLNRGMYHINKKRFQSFFDYHKNKVKSWNEEIKKYKAEKNDCKVYLFGAHITSQYYLAYGLEEWNISGVLDNNPDKQGKRIGGRSWFVQSTEVLETLENPIVILSNSPYREEIKEGILRDRNPGAIFIY